MSPEEGENCRCRDCYSLAMSPEPHRLVRQILNAAQSVHSALGCGLIESVYARALLVELNKTDLRIEREKLIKIWYGSHIVGKHFLDLVVGETVLIELKAARAIVPVHAAQMKSYLHATGYSTGLILNFGMPELQWELLQSEKREGAGTDGNGVSEPSLNDR